MRAGGCTLQHALTPDAATLVKQSVNLAKRRGHAQVTPLHVASTMLSSSSGPLRAACLQSHSHPLQCKALELCFNVALNRLPASASSTPILGHPPHHHHHHHHHPPPALSNALVAAFKRAQAHQRRGSIESQQQPLLAVKIEIEQLVISILDDPSVSRVMREAGFSSTQVKSNVEHAVSLDLPSSTAPSTALPGNNKPKEDHHHHHDHRSVQLGLLSPQAAGKCAMATEQARNEDVMSVVECLMGRKKRSVVVVGECLATTEGVVKGTMDMVERGEVPDVLKAVQLINLPLFSFAHLSRDEVEQKVGELRCLVKSCCVGRGVVLYLGDLRWAAEYRASCGEKGRAYYCPVEHAMVELGRMIPAGVGHEANTGSRFWFVGIATYQTYMRCRIGHPSLEALWGLHPLTIPSGSLGLSLSHDSYLQSPSQMKRNGDASQWSMPDSGCDCSTTKSENGTRTPPPNASPTHATLITSALPSWLQRCKEEKASSRDLERPRARNFFSNFNDDQMITNQSCSVPLNPRHRCGEGCFWTADADDCDRECLERSPGEVPSSLGQDKKRSPTLLGLQNPSPLSTSVSDSMEMEYHHRFKELNAENLKTICVALEEKAPWQMDMIPEIASTVLQCRSGMIRRKERCSCNATGIKEDTWLFFQGCDAEGKEIICRELANLVFGCHNSFVSMGLRKFPSTKSDCSEDGRDNKRARSEESYIERFSDAIRDNPHRVFLVEDVEQLDHHSQGSIKAAMERGMVCCSNGEEFGVEDAIVVLSCESFDSRSRACSPPTRQKVGVGDEADKEEHCGEEEATSSCVSLDLNVSVEDCGQVEESSPHGLSLVDSVDRRFLFRMKDDL